MCVAFCWCRGGHIPRVTHRSDALLHCRLHCVRFFCVMPQSVNDTTEVILARTAFCGVCDVANCRGYLFLMYVGFCVLRLVYAYLRRFGLPDPLTLQFDGKATTNYCCVCGGSAPIFLCVCDCMSGGSALFMPCRSYSVE